MPNRKSPPRAHALTSCGHANFRQLSPLPRRIAVRDNTRDGSSVSAEM
jgi:hypothetical protein